MTISEVSKALGAFVAGAGAVEASGAVTGVADHWLKVAIAAVISGAAAFGIVFTIPNSSSKTQASEISDADLTAAAAQTPAV